jgi:hypothetical protein
VGVELAERRVAAAIDAKGDAQDDSFRSVGHWSAWRLLAAAGAMMLVAGCARPHTPYPQSFNSFLPEERILAARHAAELHDRGAIPLLVDRLEDDDPAVRLFTILALEKLTGTRLGYDYRSDDLQRARAAQRWRRYVADLAASQPATAPALAVPEPSPASAPAQSQPGMAAGGVGQ